MRKITIVLFILLFISLIFAQALYFVIPYLWKNWEKASHFGTNKSNKYSETLKIAGDMWLGYFIFRSPQFIEKMEKAQINYEFVIENDFQKRFEGLNSQFDMVVSTVGFYVRNGYDSRYGGSVIFAIDESSGGDGIVAPPPYTDIDKLNDPAIKIGVVPDSPSEYLLNVLISNFNLTSLQNNTQWKVKCENEKDGYLKLKDGQINAAVLWEPFLSRSIKEIKGVKLLTDTKDCDDLIVDVAIVSHNSLSSKRDSLKKFTSLYFETLIEFLKNPSELKKQTQKDGELDDLSIDSALKGIEFIDFNDNISYWFGLGDKGSGPEKLCAVINNSQEVMTHLKIFPQKPIKDPFALIEFSLLQNRMKESGLKAINPTNKKTAEFKDLSDYSEWEKNTERVGAIQTEPIYFPSGQSLLSLEGKAVIDELAKTLIQYPRYRFMIHGFSSPEGDPKPSLELSEQRASAIKNYLERTWKFNPKRVFSKGFGMEKPLPRLTDEGKRAWLNRNQRVEFALLRDL